MATAVLQTAEDQITCSICLEIFEEPKALPCLHTFCKKCIVKFILETNVFRDDVKGYACPVCRRFVQAPSHLKWDPQLWVNYLENNHVVSTMIDAYTNRLNKSSETCREHPEKELEFFCIDHSILICSLCSLKHRRCSDVITRESAHEKQKNENPESHKNAEKYIDLVMEQCNAIEHIIDERNDNIEFMNRTENSIRDQIISTRKRINDLLNKHEEKVLTQLAKMKTKTVDKIEMDKKKMESYGEMSRKLLKKVQSIVDSGKIINEKVIESIKTDYKNMQLKILNEKDRKIIDLITFSIAPAIQTFITQFDSFGKLQIEVKDGKNETDERTPDRTAVVSTTPRVINAQFTLRNHGSGIHDFTIPSERKTPWITGMSVLPSDRLLLVDHTNETLLLFDSSLKFIAKTCVTPAPYDVAVVSPDRDRIMISFPDHQVLRQCDVLPDACVDIGQRLKTNIACRSIAFDNPYIAMCSNTDVQVFETDGETWLAILEEAYSRTKFTYVTLSAAQKRLFLTDQSYPDPHVRCLTFDGTTLWQVTDDRVSFATGISVIGSQILMTSWDKGKLFSMSFKGQNIMFYNDFDVSFPWGLHVAPKQKRIFVSQYKNKLSEVEKRTIRIFPIQ